MIHVRRPANAAIAHAQCDVAAASVGSVDDKYAMNKEKQKTVASVGSALLIHAGALGDFVMSLRIVSSLRAHGARHIAVLGRPGVASIAMPGGCVDEVIDIETGGFHALFSADLPLPARAQETLRRQDLVVNTLCDRGRTAAARLRAAGVRRVIEIETSPRPDWTGHVSEQWLTDLRVAGLTEAPAEVRIIPDDEHRKGARRFLNAQLGGDVGQKAVLAPGSGSLRKCWGIDSFVSLSRRLQALGYHTVFLLGPVEQEMFRDEQVARLEENAPVLRGLALSMTAGVLAEARVFVGNDSGVAHLAAALGTPTVAVFGPTNPKTWRPWGPRVAVAAGPRPGDWPKIESVLEAVRQVVDPATAGNCDTAVGCLYSEPNLGGMTRHVGD